MKQLQKSVKKISVAQLHQFYSGINISFPHTKNLSVSERFIALLNTITSRKAKFTNSTV